MHPYRVRHHTQHTHTLFAIAEMRVILNDVNGANGILLSWPLPRTTERRGSISAVARACIVETKLLVMVTKSFVLAALSSLATY